jgi:uncharacterized membrane protein
VRDRFLWIGCTVYAAVFTWLGAVKYAAHRNLVDFGIFAQTVTSAFGCFCNPIEGSHWAFHFSPILYAAAIVLRVVHSPLTLVALQAIAGALAAPPIYGLVRSRSDAGRARLAALVVWLYPPLAGLIFGDFHENGFAPAAVAWTLYAFDAGLLAWAFAGSLVTLAIKEDQAIFLAVAGALGAWRFRGTKRGWVAAAVAAIAILVFVAFFEFIRPHAASAGAQGWQPWRFYAWNGASARALSAGIGARLGFLLLIFAPLAFLPFRSRWVWLSVAPLAEVLLSRMPTTFTLGTHYAGAWIGYLLTAFGCAVRELAPRPARTALFACVALCAVEFAVADPLHPGLNLRRAQPRDTALDAFLRTLPRGADVATQEEAYTHLALTDPNAGLLPQTAVEPLHSCFVLIDRSFPDSARFVEYGAQFERLVQEHRYILVAQSDGAELYLRLGGCR